MDRERWLSLKDLARQLGCSTRWLEYRLHEGMPSAVIAGRRKCRQSEVELWLEQHGHLLKEGAA
ncbi:MAG TPA: hypothetical protein VH247_00915 [Thermoleophilaceae bacterium]|jgi:hypothetical protein|nr:hypothetical protein [Thermoleophilaceae bacterium]